MRRPARAGEAGPAVVHRKVHAEIAQSLYPSPEQRRGLQRDRIDPPRGCGERLHPEFACPSAQRFRVKLLNHLRPAPRRLIGKITARENRRRLGFCEVQPAARNFLPTEGFASNSVRSRGYLGGAQPRRTSAEHGDLLARERCHDATIIAKFWQNPPLCGAHSSSSRRRNSARCPVSSSP